MEHSTEVIPSAPVEGSTVASAAPKRPGVWSGLGTVALYFLLQFGLSILVGMLIGVVLGIEAGVQAAAANHKPDLHSVIATMRASPDIRVILAVGTIIAATAVMVVVVRRTWPAQWSRADLPGFGLVQPANKWVFPGAALLGVAVLVLGGALTHLLAGHQPVHQDVVMMAAKATGGMRILLALLVVCVAPFVEELVFRGVLLAGLASRMHVAWAVLVSALIFGCAHLPDFGFLWYPVPALVVMGLVLAWLRVKTRSLWPSVTLHATNNAMAVLAWFLASHHP